MRAGDTFSKRRSILGIGKTPIMLTIKLITMTCIHSLISGTQTSKAMLATVMQVLIFCPLYFEKERCWRFIWGFELAVLWNSQIKLWWFISGGAVWKYWRFSRPGSEGETRTETNSEPLAVLTGVISRWECLWQSSIIMSMQKLWLNGNNSARFEESCGTFYTGNDDRSGLCFPARLLLVLAYKYWALIGCRLPSCGYSS